MPELTDLSVIRALCEKYDFALSKGFGQNFIINPGLPPKIVDASGVDRRYGVIEIGPGIGVLTRELGRAQKPFQERDMRTANSTAINRVTFLQEEAHAAFLPVLPFIPHWTQLHCLFPLGQKKPFPQRKRSPAQQRRCPQIRMQPPRKPRR